MGGSPVNCSILTQWSGRLQLGRVQLAHTDRYMLDCGFDEATVIADGHLVRDIQAASRAYQAGLRLGDRFVKSLPTDDTNYFHVIEAEIVRDGVNRSISIEYWPRRHALIETRQYYLCRQTKPWSNVSYGSVTHGAR